MKALVVFSGGLDSTVCLAKAVEKHGNNEVMALSMIYGQKHSKELECAGKVAEHYGVQHRILDMTEIFKDSECTLLSKTRGDIPVGSYEEQQKGNVGHPVSTYVPFRNALFVSVAVSIALSNGCCEVYYGIHQDDSEHEAYPDCSVKFHESMSKAVYEGSGHQIMLVAPYVSSHKSDIVADGLRMGVPFELTWSCYKGGERPCGKCGTCIDRRKAFEANGVEDPLEAMYEN